MFSPLQLLPFLNDVAQPRLLGVRKQLVTKSFQHSLVHVRDDRTLGLVDERQQVGRNLLGLRSQIIELVEHAYQLAELSHVLRDHVLVQRCAFAPLCHRSHERGFGAFDVRHKVVPAKLVRAPTQHFELIVVADDAIHLVVHASQQLHPALDVGGLPLAVQRPGDVLAHIADGPHQVQSPPGSRCAFHALQLFGHVEQTVQLAVVSLGQTVREMVDQIETDFRSLPAAHTPRLQFVVDLLDQIPEEILPPGQVIHERPGKPVHVRPLHLLERGPGAFVQPGHFFGARQGRTREKQHAEGESGYREGSVAKQGCCPHSSLSLAFQGLG